MKRKNLFGLSEIFQKLVTFPLKKKSLDTWGRLYGFPQYQAQKALEEARNSKLSGNHKAHLTVYPNEVIKTLLEAVK